MNMRDSKLHWEWDGQVRHRCQWDIQFRRRVRQWDAERRDGETVRMNMRLAEPAVRKRDDHTHISLVLFLRFFFLFFRLFFPSPLRHSAFDTGFYSQKTAQKNKKGSTKTKHGIKKPIYSTKEPKNTIKKPKNNTKEEKHELIASVYRK